MQAKTKSPRTIRFIMEFEGKIGVIVKQYGRSDGYWLTPVVESDWGVTSVIWQHETDSDRRYTVEMGQTRPSSCDCPARGDCRHMAGTAKLIELGYIKRS